MAGFGLRQRRALLAALMVAAPFALSPAQAEVTHTTDHGFAVLHVMHIAAPPEAVWAVLIAPQRFWNPRHSWSGDAANLYLDPQAGGCFCERLPAKSGASTLNSVEHMRVIYSESPRVLRLSGALGPLQSEAAVGTMNIAMEAHDGGTKISMSYVVGGFLRMPVKDIAPGVDAVIGEQLARLKAVAEGRNADTAVWPPKGAPVAPKGTPATAKSSAAPMPANAKPATAADPKATPAPNPIEGAKAAVPSPAKAPAPVPTPAAAPKKPLADRLADPMNDLEEDDTPPVAKPADPATPVAKPPVPVTKTPAPAPKTVEPVKPKTMPAPPPGNR